MKVNLFFFNFQKMIQRIQSLYLFIYLINKCFSIYISFIDERSLHFIIHKIDLFKLFAIFLIIISAITLFRFKNRKTQIKLSYLLITIQLIVLLFLTILAYKADNSVKFLQNYQTFTYIIGLVLLLLSLKGIKKDQNLIDSIDRIR